MYIKKMLKNIFMRDKLMVWKKAKLKMKTGQTYKVVLVVKNLPTISGDTRDARLILKTPWRKKWRTAPFSVSRQICLENSMNREA